MDFSVYAYRVGVSRDGIQPFEQLLQQIEAIPIGNRIKGVAQTELRLEELQHRPANRVAFDLTRLRFNHGPARADRNRRSQGFNLAATEAFGEETAFLYDPQLRVLLVQYNHFGARVGTAQNYFNTWLPELQEGVAGGYEFVPVLDLTAERRFRELTEIRSVSFKVAASKVTREEYQLGASVEDALDIGRDFRADKVRIDVTCDAGNRRGISRPSVTRLLRALRPMSVDLDAVDLTVGGKREDGQSDAIDLFADRLKAEATNIPENRVDRRVPFVERANALERIRVGWAAEFQDRFAE